ncbi:ATP-binding cassette domain-containing protein [Tardiphaga sp. vice154]|uniref:ABC transporter ATP-binding protein n=1 Tax=Tardiphaga sp. vice154 TaxID=2592814 RepID=UPI001161CF2E|nr:ATP-binding cassette domain-containing protein [Tardiphaga sp. vice154]QDM23416.1 ATP-binding cassette domain-containing protein [Tardiphaga sp. vice154]
MSEIDAAPALAIEGLTKAFGGLIAVNKLDLVVGRGEIVGLLGPNGSGKTTALNLISGVLQPNAGQIYFAGHDVAGWPTHRVARLGLARTFQLVRLLDGMSCAENVRAGLAFHRPLLTGAELDASETQLLARVGLAGFGPRAATDLTYIDRKRLELARALALRPRLLLLDEWLAGLNPSELLIGIELIRSLKQEGLSILLVEHVMDAIRSLCDRCVVMSSGRKIAEGTPEMVLSNDAVIEAYLGAPLDA